MIADKFAAKVVVVKEEVNKGPVKPMKKTVFDE